MDEAYQLTVLSASTRCGRLVMALQALIFASSPLEGKLSGKVSGEWASDFKTYLHFQCGEGILVVQELQLEGKKRMKVDELLRGWKG